MLVDAEVVDRDDRRVLELALHARLAHEARATVGLGHVLGPHDLQRDVAPDASIVAEPDLAHAALAERRADGVAPFPGRFGEGSARRVDLTTVGARSTYQRDGLVVGERQGLSERIGHVGRS